MVYPVMNLFFNLSVSTHRVIIRLPKAFYGNPPGSTLHEVYVAPERESVFYAASFKGTLSLSEMFKKSNELRIQLKVDGVRIRKDDGILFYAEYPGVGSAEGRTDILTF